MEKEDRTGVNIPKSHSSFNSFADQFINNASERKEKKIHNKVTERTEFSKLYLQNAEKDQTVYDENPDNPDVKRHGRPYRRVLRDNNKAKKPGHQQQQSFDNSGKNQNNQYTAMHDTDRKSLTKWKFRDLQNKKQTGDLYRKILHFYKKNDFKIFNFASCRPGEGVSTILANLLNYAKNNAANKKVIAIDANLQSPNLHKIFNISNSYGLIDIFNNEAGINETVVQVSSNIYALTCGKGADTVSGNLNQENFIKLLNHYRQLYDYIFIDCPPIVSSADALSIAPAADISFIIIRSAKVQRAVAERAKALLEDNECRIGGAVLNHVRHVIPSWLYRFI